MASTIKVYAPAGPVDETVSGVQFTKGVAEVDRGDRASLAYFRRHGYRIEGETPADPEGRPIDARDAAVPAVVGTRLRDAAVDPRAADFLPPSNAGEADPHGPEVVSPGLHGVEGVRPITPGVVPPPAPQEAKETAAAEQATSGETVDPTAFPQPRKNDPVGVWRDYAVHAHEMDRAEADDLTKAELVKRFGGEG